jgi:two-component system, NtrC family, response regulator HydG
MELSTAVAGIYPVLVVEDDLSLRSMLETLLRRSGFPVDTAEDGEVALDAVRSRPYGAIVLDLVMPKLDGVEFLRVVREENPSLLARTIVATGASGKIVDEAGASGVFALVVKPFDIIDFVRVVTLCVGQAKLERKQPESIPCVTARAAAPSKNSPNGFEEAVRREIRSREIELKRLLDSDEGSPHQMALRAELRKTISQMSLVLEEAVRYGQNHRRLARLNTLAERTRELAREAGRRDNH